MNDPKPTLICIGTNDLLDPSVISSASKRYEELVEQGTLSIANSIALSSDLLNDNFSFTKCAELINERALEQINRRRSSTYVLANHRYLNLYRGYKKPKKSKQNRTTKARKHKLNLYKQIENIVNWNSL